MDNTSEARKKKMMRRRRVMLRKTHRRINAAFIIVFAILLVLGVRIFMINYTHGEEYSKAVLNHQTYKTTTIPYRRGNITSSDGTVLAYSEKVYNLILDVKSVKSEDGKYLNSTIDALVDCFNLDRDKIKQVINDNPESQYQKLLKELSSDEIAGFNELKANKSNNIYGVWFEESYVRKYPFSTLACDVIGFASNVNGGELGLESQYDDELSGTDGVTYSYVDENLNAVETTKSAVNGNNIVTTIDYNVQSIIEKKIVEYNAQKPSVNTGIVVMNPKNGEILGMASYPQFDLNNPRKLNGIYDEEQLAGMTDEDITNALYKLWTNYCVSQSYEPGSPFKPFTIAAGLEEGVIHDGDTFECKGYEYVGSNMIKCHSYSTTGSHGVINLSQSLENSCNPYMINIAIKLGNVRFAQYEKMFGFGAKTGIDLPGEATGIMYDEDKITTIDAATNSFGQNINVNMVQMISAYCSLINDGKYYQPHIVKRIESANGEVVKENLPVLVRQTVTPSTSKYLRTYLENTVKEGTAHKAYIDGYSIAGKTGTAQKIPRDDLKWVISFIGHAPADDPKFAIYIVLDEPDGTTGTSGSTSDALLLAKEICTELLPYMNVYKDTDEPYVDPGTAPEESGVDGIPASSAVTSDNTSTDKKATANN